MLPPLYIFDLRAEKSGKFKIEPSWVEGLQTITGKFGRDKKFIYHSSVDFCQKGSTDKNLFQLYVDKIFPNTYPNSSRTIEKENRTVQLLKVLVFPKVDSGPGSISKSKDNVYSRWQIWEREIVIILGLPRFIVVTQDMVDL